MQTFFKKNPNNSSEDEVEYDFTPIKNNSSDEDTQSLFEQLEEGAKYSTQIYRTVMDGANLYAKKTEGDFENCYPIHIAAYNVACNIEAIDLLLQTFNDPQERKKYIYLKDPTGKNALEILIEGLDIEQENLAQDIVLPSIKSILSYLTADEQKNLISSLSVKAKKILTDDITEVSREKDINDLAQLNYFLQQGKSIDMCKQRRKEEAKVLADYESDEESLGQLNSVYNKKFTARVSYKDIVKDGVVVNSIPELILIPSDWRLETATANNNQGDHVIAYVLLLSSFSHCKGENVKQLPELVYNLTVTVLPDDKALFLKEKKKIDEILDKHRTIRVEAVASLEAECDKGKIFVSAVENNLKKAEIDAIARYMEDSIDQFITIINKLEDESFAQSRKQSITGRYVLEQLTLIVGKNDLLQENKYSNFKNIFLEAIIHEAKNPDYQKKSVVDQTLKNITEAVLKKDLDKVVIPNQLLSKTGQLTKENLFSFLKCNTPFKKRHEGHAINHINEDILNLEEITNQNQRNKILNHIGFLCFKLFDYPKVNNPELNNEYVLYQAIPRHWIIINAAFSDLKKLPNGEKQKIYNAFLSNILVLQLWENHPVLNADKEETPLNLQLLKERILEFADLDENHNFSMKPRSAHPEHLHVGEPVVEKPKIKNKVLT